MRVLQLGTENWQKKYRIPKEITWCFKDPTSSKIFEKEHNKKNDRYHILIITNPIVLKEQTWHQLHALFPPYDVLIMPGIKAKLDETAQYFLKCKVAEEIKEDPQFLIDHLLIRYSWEQYGRRFPPSDLYLNRGAINRFKYTDSQHFQFTINSVNEWQTIGTYRHSFTLTQNKISQLWLEAEKGAIQLRLKLFIRDFYSDGNISNTVIVPISSSWAESVVPLPVSDDDRLMTIIVQAKGKGTIKIGPLHLSWFREGRGELVAGGRRIVNLKNFEEIVYYYNPGDLKPPLNVYFSGANWVSLFEGLGLFQKLGTPSLLFSDLRLEAGQYYDDLDGYVVKKIKEVIFATLKKLGFTNQQLLLNGASMGSYAALNIGATLQPYAINVDNPITQIGYIASRYPLERPFNYDTSLDVVKRLTDKSLFASPDQLNTRFWNRFNQADLSKTRVFVAYKKNDDYDRAIDHLKCSPAIKRALQFSYKGFLGRHTDNQVNSINWFSSRLKQVLKNDFNRSVE